MGKQELFEIEKAKTNLPNFAFLTDELYNSGCEAIPISSDDYPPILKRNLKFSSPPLLYIKGNKKILKEPNAAAIVGSRDASKVSLDFTDNIAKLFSRDYTVVVSGFAKGVDRQALDSAVKYGDQSIIVLPQGILTFKTNDYYSSIAEGNVIALSTFHPKSPWSKELAMARNATIYNLANKVYVAQSSDKGGTWSGAMAALKKNNTVYVRMPEAGENNANLELIKAGAKPVDFNGEAIITDYHKRAETDPPADTYTAEKIPKLKKKQGTKKGKKKKSVDGQMKMF